MAAGISRPDVWFGYAANRDPNDLNTPSVWTPLESSRLQVLASTGQARGRDYELAQPLAADPVLLVRDINEDLNPDNPSSPLAGLVQPYREIAAVAQWPVTATAPAVNLINTGTWRGSAVDGYDPTFDGYSAGFAAPNWLDRVGGVTATVTTTNPQQGTKSVTYAVDTSGVGQGLAWGVPCIPGRQYTSSVYVRQSAANTVGLFLEGVTGVFDRWNRTVVDGLGTPNASWNGGGYTIAPNVPADYDVSGGQMTITLSASNVLKYAVSGSFFSSRQVIRVRPQVTAAGDFFWQGLVSRHLDVSNQYRAYLQLNPDGSMAIAIRRRLAAVETTLASTTLPLHYAPGDEFYLSFTHDGSVMEAHCWPVAAAESLVYSTGSVTDTSAALQAPGAVGIFAWRSASNTNTNLPASFGQYAATCSVAGTTTSTSGSYQRLSITYTADGLARPAAVDLGPLGQRAQGLAISVLAIGATSASTMNIDAIQHEQSASASAFNASGPVIYPLFRNFAERYPRTWRAKGYEGVVAIPCVDALALLNKIFVSNAADQAFANSQPDLFYSLAGGTDSTLFPDVSGNGGPALREIVGKLNAGPVAPGTAIAIVGDPNATGVLFTPVTGPPTGGNLIGTGTGGTGVGIGVPGAPPAIPGTPGIPWQMSLGGWFVSTGNGSAQSLVRVFGRAFSVSLQIQSSGNMLMFAGIPGTAFFTTVTVPFPVSDGLPHFAIGTLTMDGTNTTISCYVDSGGPVSSTVATSTLNGLVQLPMDTIQVGGVQSDFTSAYGTILNGTAAKIGIWKRALSAGQISAIYSGGASGLNGEASGARILRHLRDGPYNGPTRIAQSSASQPQTLMGIPSFDGQIDLLTDSLNTMQAEQGMFWVQPDGVLAFEGRQQRWLRTLSSYTFGESGATGEISYQDGIIFDNDPTYVYPIVTWTRTSGATALGGLQSDRRRAVAAFFPREFSGQNDLYDDATAQYIADWIFYSHRSPNTRVAEIEIDPWAAQATPWSLWAKVLNLEVGTRVTAVRRVKSANGGAGLTMSLPMFIERVGFPEMNFQMGQERWTVALQLSPVGSAAAGQPTVQPWILEDATYGVLDSTTVLGF